LKRKEEMKMKKRGVYMEAASAAPPPHVCDNLQEVAVEAVLLVEPVAIILTLGQL
tara:strand:+ start:587 stop:751 length:165 start_codon:yes stop_codon:yes gene_type:complete